MAGYNVGFTVYGLSGVPVSYRTILVSVTGCDCSGSRRRSILLRYGCFAKGTGPRLMGCSDDPWAETVLLADRCKLWKQSATCNPSWMDGAGTAAFRTVSFACLSDMKRY